MKRFPVLLLLLLAAAGAAAAPDAGSLEARAARVRRQLAGTILPYWYDTAQDPANGGYLFADRLEGRGTASEKQVVTQARMVWTFSRVHRAGFRDPKRDYLAAAAQGCRFLTTRFLDPEHGGYFWTTEPDGRVRNARKFVYGQSFVLYALVEYHRASGERRPLEQAMDLFRTLQRRAHDERHGGWTEHFERDWTPLPLRAPEGLVEVAGLRSANTHLHLMESLTELYLATTNAEVRAALEESLRINREQFYPREAGRSCFHRNPDGSPVTDPASAGLSYGHNVEFAWLMAAAERALGREPSWDHFRAHLDHALRYGWDAGRGGLYHRGEDDRPATDLRKVWWVQAEMLAALTEGLVHRREPPLESALAKLLDFTDRFMADPRDGVWVDSVKPDGSPDRTDKAHNWKANYHDVRALLKFADAFAPRDGGAGGAVDAGMAAPVSGRR